MLTPLALALTSTLALAATGPASNLLPRAILPTVRTVGVDVWAMGTRETACALADTPLTTSLGPESCTDVWNLIGGPTVHAELPVGNRGAVDLRGGWVGDEGEGTPLMGAFLRVRAYGNEDVTVTPWVGGVTTVSGLLTPDSAGSPGMWAAGAAVDAGGDRVRVDLSLPVVALVEDDGNTDFIPFGLPAMFSEAGVRFQVAPAHTLRVGTASLAPGVSWRGALDGADVEVAVHGIAGVVFTRASVSKAF